MGNPLCPYFLDEGVKVDVATCLSVPSSSFVSCPNCPVDDSLLLLVPLAHAMPCQPRCPWLTPSVSSSWAEPSAYCYRADIFFVHPYRPRLALSALRLSPFCVLTHRSISGHASAILALSSASKSVQLLCSVYFASYLIFSVIYVMTGKIFSFSLIHSFPCTLFTATEHHFVRCSQAHERQNIRTNHPSQWEHHTIPPSACPSGAVPPCTALASLCHVNHWSSFRIQ